MGYIKEGLNSAWGIWTFCMWNCMIKFGGSWLILGDYKSISLVFKFWFGLGNIIRLSSVSKFVCGIVKEYYVDHKIP